jgi:hypothetical protein
VRRSSFIAASLMRAAGRKCGEDWRCVQSGSCSAAARSSRHTEVRLLATGSPALVDCTSVLCLCVNEYPTVTDRCDCTYITVPRHMPPNRKQSDSKEQCTGKCCLFLVYRELS